MLFCVLSGNSLVAQDTSPTKPTVERTVDESKIAAKSDDPEQSDEAKPKILRSMQDYFDQKHRWHQNVARQFESRSKLPPKSKELVRSLFDRFASIKSYQSDAKLQYPYRPEFDAEAIECWRQLNKGKGRANSPLTVLYLQAMLGHGRFKPFKKHQGKALGPLTNMPADLRLFVQLSMTYWARGVPKFTATKVQAAQINALLAFAGQRNDLPASDQFVYGELYQIYLHHFSKDKSSEVLTTNLKKHSPSISNWMRHMVQGMIAKLDGDNATASKHFSEADKLHPNRPEAATMMIELAARGGSELTEMQWFERATSTVVDFWPAYCALLQTKEISFKGNFEKLALMQEWVDSGSYDTRVPMTAIYYFLNMYRPERYNRGTGYRELIYLPFLAPDFYKKVYAIVSQACEGYLQSGFHQGIEQPELFRTIIYVGAIGSGLVEEAEIAREKYDGKFDRITSSLLKSQLKMSSSKNDTKKTK